jgi:hypothetical protein
MGAPSQLSHGYLIAFSGEPYGSGKVLGLADVPLSRHHRRSMK